MPPKRYTLLIADDDRLLRETMRMSLRSSYDVILAVDGKEAVDAFTQNHVDAVLLDGAMPNMSGYEACTAIRGMPRGERLPICICTSSEDESMLDRAFDAGATDFFLKPADLGLLGRKIRHQILRAAAKAPPDPGSTCTAESAELLFKALPDPALMLGKNNCFCAVNPAFQRAFPELPSPEGKGPDALFKVVPEPFEQFDRKLPLKHDAAQQLRVRVVTLSGDRRLVRVDPVNDLDGGNTTPTTRSIRILLLEDQELVSRSITRLLERARHQVKLVERGDDAVAEFARAARAGEGYELVLLDLSIPGSRGGAEVLQSLRKVDASVIAIATSGSWEDPVMRHPGRYGFNAVLPKPFNREDLLGVIAAVVDAK